MGSQENLFNKNTAIPLIATEIRFTEHSIYYKVKIDTERSVSGVVFCGNDIKNKDLILNPTYVDQDNNEVCFVSGNVMPSFYAGILSGTIKDIDEYIVELGKIYSVGEVVGYLLP